MERQQRIVHFAGSVQGVGFRYTACRAAAGFDVTGYVRNLSDGRVECVVEGAPGEIDAFLAELARQMHGYIRRRTEQTAPASGAFEGFGVRY
ncbi:MAG TPA: acylphosphatase [Phycisphaerales bacterium]|nr:acylphosphatase [Phycisphaerales bacterium]